LKQFENGFAGFLIITMFIYLAFQHSSEINIKALEYIYGGFLLITILCVILIKYIKYKKISKYMILLALALIGIVLLF